MGRKKEGDEAAAASTPAEKAEEFFGQESAVSHEKIYVTSDLWVFVGTAKGKNALDNYLAANKELTFETFTK